MISGAADRPMEFHVTFVPTAGEASPRLASGETARRPANHSRDNDAIRKNPRRSYLEGRRPRRLVATHNIRHIDAFVPAAGAAPPRLAAGPPIVPPIIMRFTRIATTPYQHLQAGYPDSRECSEVPCSPCERGLNARRVQRQGSSFAVQGDLK